MVHFELPPRKVFLKLTSTICILGLLSANFQAFGQKPGQAIDINGGSEHVSVPDDNSLDISNQLTISFWMNADDVSAEKTILQKGNTGSNINYGVEIYDAGGGFGSDFTLRFISFNNTDLEFNSFTNLPNTNEWVHIAITYDNGNVKLYYNGNNESSGNHGRTSLPTNSNDLLLGQGNKNNYDGNFDEVRIWNTARTEQEIQKYMHQVAPTSNSNLVAYYQFEGNANDQSANTNDGNLQNSPQFVTSHAVLTNAGTLEAGGTFENDLKAVWQAKNSTDETGGLKIDGSGFSSGDYIIYGHNAGSSRDTLTSNSTIDQKLQRDWGFDVQGNPPSVNLTFITSKAGESGFSSYNQASDYLFLSESSVANGGYTDEANADIADETNNSVSFNNISVTTETYSLGTSDASSSPLPVELLYFEARKNGGNARLEWATASEVNNKHFVVQRKTGNDREWQNIGQVEGQGTTTERHDYSFEDPDLSEGIHYYRLKQVDLDGSYEYHPVKVLQVGDETHLGMKIIPHSAQNQVELNLNLPESGHYKTTILNMQGRLIHKENQQLVQGQQAFSVPMHNASSGIYLLRLQGNGHATQKKFIVK